MTKTCYPAFVREALNQKLSSTITLSASKKFDIRSLNQEIGEVGDLEVSINIQVWYVLKMAKTAHQTACEISMGAIFASDPSQYFNTTMSIQNICQNAVGLVHILA